MKSQNKISFTKEGYANLKKEYEILFSSRKDAVVTLSRAREMGDLSENGFYKAAKQKLSSIDYNLRRLKYLIKQAEIVENKNRDVISVGSKITIEENGIPKIFYVVGEYEANPAKGNISDKSPIGKALIGIRKGENVLINTPKGAVRYKVLSVE